MATKVILPKLGQTMEEGAIVQWHKQEGDDVARGDVLFEIESDKAVLEVESRSKGVLLKILLEPGVKVPVGTLAGVVGKAGEDISGILAEGGEATDAAAPASAEPAAAEAPVEAAAPAAAAPEPVHAAGERIFASPRARKLAEEKGVDLAYVSGTGPNGRIIEKDITSYLETQPAATPLARKMAVEAGISLQQVPASGARITSAQIAAATTGAPAQAAAAAAVAEPGQLTPMAGVRRVISDRMHASSATTAPVTLQCVVDATEFVAVRTKLKEATSKELGFSIGYNDLLAAIVARCLVEYPYMNVQLEEGGIRSMTTVNVGMAVDSERGLMVPVIRDAQTMGVKQLASRFRELVAKAREGRSSPDELSGGTFTITNLGMYGIDQFTPIINLPECAILGVGRIRPEPTVVDGEIKVRQMMWLSLTFDHRLVDGAPAARFLQAITEYVEEPYLLLA